jgi:hypothetical protein
LGDEIVESPGADDQLLNYDRPPLTALTTPLLALSRR